MEAISSLYGTVLSRLRRDERPLFHNYWLKELNAQECYLFQASGNALRGTAIAFASKPRTGLTHFERWNVNHLAVAPGWTKPLRLPHELARESHFCSPLQGRGFYPVIVKVERGKSGRP